MEKIKILYGLGCYWPGHERYGASGPIQSFDAMAEALKDTCEFNVIALDRKPGSKKSAIKPEDSERWFSKDNVQVRYVRGGFADWRRISKAMKSTDYDIVVSNGFFDQGITLPMLFLKFLRLVPDQPFILSPRGEFSPGALNLKSIKKHIYLFLNKTLGITRDVILHATSEKEAELFRINNLPCKRIDIAHVVSHYFDRPSQSQNVYAEELKLAFVGRISPVKNLEGALQILSRVKSKVHFDIYGPLEDKEYWERCESLMRILPAHVTVSYKGPIANSSVPQTLSAYDAFFLPTRGENFGHVIHEALMSGLPCLISDQTPWRNLEEHGAGWDISLDNPEAFTAKIESLAQMSREQRAKLKNSTRAYGEKRWNTQDAINETLAMYKAAIQ